MPVSDKVHAVKLGLSGSEYGYPLLIEFADKVIKRCLGSRLNTNQAAGDMVGLQTKPIIFERASQSC